MLLIEGLRSLQKVPPRMRHSTENQTGNVSYIEEEKKQHWTLLLVMQMVHFWSVDKWSVFPNFLKNLKTQPKKFYKMRFPAILICRS